MNPLFFGASDAPLFGVFEPAASDVDKDHAVVLCPPLGHEYFCAHWLLRQSAQKLTRSGYSVLRFDYAGYGDSAGGTGSGNPSLWCENIAAAVDEALAASGARCASVVAIRSACCLIARSGLQDFEMETAVLVDAPESGLQWLEELRALQIAHELRAGIRSTMVAAGETGKRAVETMGSVFSDVALSELEALSWDAPESNRFRRVISLVTEQDTSGDGLKICADAWGARFEHTECADTTHWHDVAHARGPALTKKLPDQIVAAMDPARGVL